MTALRVAFIDQVGAEAGGAEQTLATFLEHVPADIEPTAVLFEDGAFADRLRKLGIDVDVVDVPQAISSSTRERMHVAAVGALPRVARGVARALSTRGIDVAYTNSMKAHLAGAFAARLARVPCLMHFHDIVDGTALTALRTAARFGSRKRIACSHRVADAVGLGETTVVYGPIDMTAYGQLPDRRTARAQLGLPADGPVVSIVGRINRWKGHDRFVRIAAEVLPFVPDAHFAIVGAPLFRDGDFVPEIETLAERLSVREKITFIPWLDDVRTIYAATDVNVNCSTREPFGRAVVEAAACGVPSICFDDSGVSETLLDGVTGRGVPAGNEAAFAAAIVDLLREKRSCESVRAGAQRFDAPRIAEAMAAVIRSAVHPTQRLRTARPVVTS